MYAFFYINKYIKEKQLNIKTVRQLRGRNLTVKKNKNQGWTNFNMHILIHIQGVQLINDKKIFVFRA